MLGYVCLGGCMADHNLRAGEVPLRAPPLADEVFGGNALATQTRGFPGWHVYCCHAAQTLPVHRTHRRSSRRVWRMVVLATQTPLTSSDLRDHAVRLRKRRERHCLRRCCDGNGEASNSNQPDHSSPPLTKATVGDLLGMPPHSVKLSAQCEARFDFCHSQGGGRC
jgi:hypothetical protein